MLETRLVHRSYLHEPRVRLVETAPATSDAEFVLTLPDVSLAPLPVALAALLDDLERTHHGARVLSYDSGAAARLERTSALARVARLAGDGDDREALLEESFGVKTYRATDGRLRAGRPARGRAVHPRRPPADGPRQVRAPADEGAAQGRGDDVRPESRRRPDGGRQPGPDDRRGLFGRRR